MAGRNDGGRGAAADKAQGLMGENGAPVPGADDKAADDGFDEQVSEELGYEYESGSKGSGDADDPNDTSGGNGNVGDGDGSGKDGDGSDDGSGDGANQDNGGDGDGSGKGGRIEDLPEDVQDDVRAMQADWQKGVDQRIGKEVARRKAAREELEEAQGDLQEARSRVRELESTSATRARDPEKYGSEKEIQQREDYLWDVEKFCRKYGREGYVGNGTEDEPQYAPEQLEERLLEVQEERERVLPRAKEALKVLAEGEKAAQKVYPDLADDTSALSKEYSKMLRVIPGLKLQKDAALMVGDMLEGRKLRRANANTQGKAGKTGKDTKPGTGDGDGKTRTPRQPTGAKARGAAGGKKSTQGDIQTKAAESGYDEDSLSELME